jgi:hypothetical protein
MNNKNIRNIVIVLIVIALIVGTRMIGSLPWWSFAVPVFLFGVATHFLKWEIPGFTLGFLAGFVVWFGLNWYLDNKAGSIVMERIAQLLGQSKWVVLLGAGLIGGILSGLALSAGEQMFTPRKPKKLAI